MISIKAKAKIISKESNPYTVDGKSGTSYKIRAIIEDEVYEFKFKADNLDLFNKLPDKGAVDLTLGITSRREMARIDIVGLEKSPA